MPLKLLSGIVRWSALLCVPGGVLWALTPLGISLSEYRFSTPAVFWKLFPAAPLLLLFGLIGLRFWRPRRTGWPGGVGFALAAAGLLLIVVGDVGKFWLDVDDTYLTLAPAYRAMRIGFLLFALGSIVFGAAALRARTLPGWGVAPFTIFSVGGLVAVTADFGTIGATLWVLFGAGWAWLGFSLLVEGVSAAWRGRRKPRAG
ncbi:MAG: hypothetical protein WA990_01090 [Rubrobacteraceae bacterium]